MFVSQGSCQAGQLALRGKAGKNGAGWLVFQENEHRVRISPKCVEMCSCGISLWPSWCGAKLRPTAGRPRGRGDTAAQVCLQGWQCYPAAIWRHPVVTEVAAVLRDVPQYVPFAQRCRHGLPEQAHVWHTQR